MLDEHFLPIFYGYAPTGQENSNTKLLTDMLLKYTRDVKTDKLGNILAIRKSSKDGSKRILLDAHYDEVCLVVTGIRDNGFVTFASPLGLDVRTLPASEVIIHSKSPIHGVVSCVPPHLIGDDKRDKAFSADELFIDTGYDTQKLKAIVKLGDTITTKARITKLKNGNFSSRALDNKLGVYVILSVLQKLKDENIGCEVAVMLSTGEEAGLRGAAAGSYNIDPNEAIVIDVCHSMVPGAKEERCVTGSKGCAIGVSPTLDKTIYKRLEEIAKSKDIPYQLEIMAGNTGTNASAISTSRTGIKTGLVSIPIKYMHTPVETVDIKDLNASIDLICEYIRGINNDN